MPATVIVGTQWGDEGKGKIVDILSERADVVVRYQGGANAGHTVVVDGKTIILHLIPCGILWPGKVCYIGNGVVVDPEALLQETELLESQGVDVGGRLFLSRTAHLILPYHKSAERALEQMLGERKIGTAGRGIGPAYTDKARRLGVRVCDLLDRETLRQKLDVLARRAVALEREAGGTSTQSVESVVERYSELGERLRPMMVDVSEELNRALDDGRSVLFEGAQGTMLDVDHGTYPFVSSSNATSGGACTGTGVGPTRIDEVVGVAKAYTTRVGNGPFPSELPPEASSTLREAGAEYGATTGRPRRCGWFDAVVVRHSITVNGISRLYLTKLDVLDGHEELKICTGYKFKGERLRGFPPGAEAMFGVEPVYETHRGWTQPVRDAKDEGKLPREALSYVRRIEKLVGVKVSGISVGSGREEMVFLS